MRISITFSHEPIVVASPALVSREIGAVIEFHGLVRQMEGDMVLEGLHYEAYEEMAGMILNRHLIELGRMHGCDAVEFVHRLGWVPVGETSLYIRVQSAHRGEALCFLTDSIDRLKLDVPIWKRVDQ